MHGRGAGVVGAAQKYKLQPALSGDGLDYTQRAIQGLEYGALFDVELHVSECSRGDVSFGNFFWMQAEIFDGLAYGDRVCILTVQERFVEPADQRAAADEGLAETHSFFFGETDHFDSEGKLFSVQGG